jgi:hypothetical protein
LAGFSSFQPQDGFYFSRSEMKIKKSLLILGKKIEPKVPNYDREFVETDSTLL